MMSNNLLDDERKKKLQRAQGFTLLELLLVVAMVGVLTCMATWGGSHFSRGWSLRRAGHQLLEDLKAVQAQAEMSGSLTMDSGTLVMQRTFLVFEPAENSYMAYRWRDHDGDGRAETGESVRLWRKSLPTGASFDYSADIDRRACSNVVGAPSGAISFSSPDYAPCDDRPCIKFDQNGFSVTGPGGLYLYDGEQTLAITGTRPGHFTMCQWNGQRWQ